MEKKSMKYNPSPSCLYGLGFVGAAVYFISNAIGFWMGVLGFFKAIVWPAFLVYEAFTPPAGPASRRQTCDPV